MDATTTPPMNARHPYDALTPEVILESVETFGDRATGAFTALNSYENRVYRVVTESAGPVAVKFYRPGRWTDAQILEEHAFALELAAQEIPVVAPRVRDDGKTLCEHAGFRFTVFPWQPGRAGELNTREQRTVLGRYLGRLHRVGRASRFRERPAITVDNFGRESVALVQAGDFLPTYIRDSYRTLTDELLDLIAARVEAVLPATLRLHGDCHLGNVLWAGETPFLVDLDDSRTGPAVQDLWMLLSGTHAEREAQLGEILGGYTQFMEFDAAELVLIEPLRTLRLLHYAAWLARRWDDPAFPAAFPWFNTPRYWEEHLQSLREQRAALDEPTLSWRPH
jgi:Ser/Thr protein kinase RdoA (MazF antagonist)